MYKGEGVDTHKYVHKSLFLHVFCDIFRCKVLLPYFVVFASFAMIIFLNVKCFTVFFSMESLIGYLEIFELDMEGSDR